MKIEIDQSGKVEKTSHHTYLAFSNKKSFIVKISSTEKQKLQRYFRQIGKRKVFVYTVFAALLIILLEKTFKNQQVVIDKEYPGKENLIKNLINQHYHNYPVDNIEFRVIGKKSPAHFFVYGAAIGKKKVDKTVTAKEILSILKRK